MVAIVTCIACKQGFHERHRDVVQAVPDGVLGGMRCGCKGECVGRVATQEAVRRCPLCDGGGCEECGGTGQKVRTTIDLGDGVVASVSGDRPLGPEAVAALAALTKAAYAQMGGSHGSS